MAGRTSPAIFCAVSSRRSQRHFGPLLAAVMAVPTVVTTHSALAANKYWDVNGATAGAGGAAPTGTWNTTTANWTTNSAGTAATTTWASGDAAFFSAGSDATDTFTITVSGTQTASAITFEEGNLTLTGGAITTGASTSSNLTVTVNSDNATITSLVTGSGGFTKAGSGTLVLNDGGTSNYGGLNNWSGAAKNYLTGGTLSVVTTYYLGNSPAAPTADYLTISNGATLQITGTGTGFTAQQANKGITFGAGGGVIDIATTTVSDAGIFLGSLNGTTLTKTGAGEMRVQVANTFQKLVVNQGFYRVGNTGVETSFGAVPTAPMADQITLENGAWLGSSNPIALNANRGITLGEGGGSLDISGGNLTIPGVISGAGSLTISTFNPALTGTRSILLTGNNTYTGVTSILKGTGLQVGNNGTTGSIVGDVVNNVQLTFSRSNTYTYAGNISGTGNVINAGSGTVILSGTNSYAGGTSSTNGMLSFAAASADPGQGVTVSGNGSIAFAYTAIDQSFVDRIVSSSTGGLAISAADAAANLDFSAVPTLHLGAASGNVTYTGNVNFGTSTVRLGGGAGTLTYTPAITDGNNVEVIGMTGGVVALAGTNTYTGGTTVKGGTLDISSDANLGAAPSSPTDNLTLAAATTLRVSGSTTLDPNRNLLIGNATGGGTVTFNITGSSVTIPGVIHGSGGTALFAKTGAGTLVLSGSNSLPGNVTISAGSLVVTNSDALGSGTKTITATASGVQLHLNATAADITLPSSFSITSSGTTLWNDAGNNTIAGNITAAAGAGDTTVTSNAGSLTLAGDIAPNTTARNLILTGSASGSVTGVIKDASATNKFVSITKNGAGTWTLSGANTYVGSTIVKAGTLVLQPAAWNPALGAGGADIQAGQLVFDYTGTSTPFGTLASAILAGTIKDSVGGTTKTIAAIDDNVSQVKLQAAYYGDLNLDQVVNADDYALIDRGFAMNLAGWTNGDLNYDNTVNTIDYLLMDSTYIAGGVPHDALNVLLAEREARFGDAYVQELLASVPEPSSLAGLLAALPFLSRRRRSR